MAFGSSKPSDEDNRRKSELTQVRSVHAVSQITPDNRKFGASWSILLRWKKSIYKMLWRHMLMYIFLYIFLTILYKFILTEDGQKVFEALAAHCSRYTSSINLMIMLGFFTSTAMQRLFSIQTNLPGTARCITVFTLSLKQDLPEGRVIIAQYARWLVLAWILTFRSVCRPLRKTYPDLNSLQNAGYISEEEKNALEQERLKGTPTPLVVIDWLLLLLKETYTQERFFCEFNYLKNVEAILTFKKSCGNTIKFATQNIPYALIQAVIIAVYGFGLVTLMARNFENKHVLTDDAIGYLPVMPSMQFFVYFAWLCFGRMSVDPFGDDDDDINVKELVESHVESSLRLPAMYSRQLADVFPHLPHKQYNDSVQL